MARSPFSPGPRERLLLGGADSLGDAELVAVLLGNGIRGRPVGLVAAALLEEWGGLSGIVRAGIGGTAGRPGVGPVKAARLAAALELGVRVAERARRAVVPRLAESTAVDAWARPRLSSLDHEELWVLSLDGRNGLRSARRAAMGGLHGMSVSPRDALRIALRDGASGFVVVHNHPSGDPTPSPEDVAFTRTLAAAAAVVDTPLLDHVVVARGGHVSLLDAGLLPHVPRAKARPARQRLRGESKTPGASGPGPPALPGR